MKPPISHLLLALILTALVIGVLGTAVSAVSSTGTLDDADQTVTTTTTTSGTGGSSAETATTTSATQTATTTTTSGQGSAGQDDGGQDGAGNETPTTTMPTATTTGQGGAGQDGDGAASGHRFVPFGSSPAAIPGRIEAEDYDRGLCEQDGTGTVTPTATTTTAATTATPGQGGAGQGGGNATPTPTPNPTNGAGNQTIVEIAGANPDFSTLVTALEAANLVETLNGTGPFTVFAPTNAAFDALPAGALEALLQDQERLTAVLTYHVAAEGYTAAEVVNMTSIRTIQGESLNVSVADGRVTVGGVNVTQTDIVASNGIIHVIDAVLVPPDTGDQGGAGNETPGATPTSTITAEATMTDDGGTGLSSAITAVFGAIVSALGIDVGDDPAQGSSDRDAVAASTETDGAGNRTIVDIASANPDFSTLVTALEAANLVETLSGPGPFTVFAPTNAAFDALPAGTLDALLQDQPGLTSVLTYHVVQGEFPADEVVNMTSIRTVQGEPLDVTVENGSVRVDGANVTQTDIRASNGVIHVIDAVMLPSGQGSGGQDGAGNETPTTTTTATATTTGQDGDGTATTTATTVATTATGQGGAGQDDDGAGPGQYSCAQGWAYFDRTPGNQGGQYREDDVDIESGASGYVVAYVKSSEWLVYSVDVPETAMYRVTLRASSPWDDRQVWVWVDGVLEAKVQVPNTGSFDSYEDVSAEVPLPVGDHYIRLQFYRDAQNLDYMEFERIGGLPGGWQGQGDGGAATQPTTRVTTVQTTSGQGGDGQDDGTATTAATTKATTTTTAQTTATQTTSAQGGDDQGTDTTATTTKATTTQTTPAQGDAGQGDDDDTPTRTATPTGTATQGQDDNGDGTATPTATSTYDDNGDDS